jgi:C4-dicarboxylate-specific signal transduction histidine kinase
MKLREELNAAWAARPLAFIRAGRSDSAAAQGREGEPLERLIGPGWNLARLQRGERISNNETVRVAKDGRRVDISLTVSPLLDKSGNVIGISTISRDITERKKAEKLQSELHAELTHLSRVTTLGEMSASIAHEVNQPIAATLTNAQAAKRWLEAEPPNLDEVRQALDRIVRDGNRAAAVVNRIRNLSKKATPQVEHMDINAAIREVIEVTRSEAMKNGVLVQTELGEGLSQVRGDRVELQQVILNLILNAVEAMSELGEGSRELLITTGKTESVDVLVAVRDSGPGLAPAAFENLFKAFYTTKRNGLGLGLSICRSIIEAHGGRLWASANSPRGAVFQFTLPADPHNALRSVMLAVGQ